MQPKRIGILHPGEMGISVAASAQKSGHQVYWASDGRSMATEERAANFELQDARTLADLSAECPILVSVCPPHAAESMAEKVLATGFRGLYLDANAISPQRTIKIGQTMEEGGVSFVDGGIIGVPAWKPGATWLYLSGRRARDFADCFSAGPLETEVLGTRVGEASALKMCFAAYSKGTRALLLAVLATAESLGVREALYRQWTHDDPDFVSQASRRVLGVTPKAWRFAGEMEEIASTFRDAGIPGDFHTGAETIYRRLGEFKNPETTPSIEDVLGVLLEAESEPKGS